jgi:hypothetical protein
LSFRGRSSSQGGWLLGAVSRFRMLVPVWGPGVLAGSLAFPGEQRTAPAKTTKSQVAQFTAGPSPSARVAMLPDAASGEAVSPSAQQQPAKAAPELKRSAQLPCPVPTTASAAALLQAADDCAFHADWNHLPRATARGTAVGLLSSRFWGVVGIPVLPGASPCEGDGRCIMNIFWPQDQRMTRSAAGQNPGLEDVYCQVGRGAGLNTCEATQKGPGRPPSLDPPAMRFSQAERSPVRRSEGR